MISKIKNLRSLIKEEIFRAQPQERMTILVGSIPLSVEIADTSYARDQGLMFRDSLEDDSGMIFIFPDCGIRGFWMKNTKIPLSIAFVDESGKILNIENMSPYDINTKYSKGPAKYAIEVNIGWFDNKGISPGDLVTI